MDVLLGAVLGFVAEAVAACVKATISAWREVRSITEATPRRAVASLLHIFLAIPFVIGTVDLGRIAARALNDDLFVFFLVILFIPIVAGVVVGASLAISGSLIGAAGCLSGNGTHRAAGLATALVAAIVGLTLLNAGSYTYGWPILALAVLVLGGHALLWAARDSD